MVAAPVDGPTHPYMIGSTACWRAFGELCAADYASADRMSFHQVIVDSYAAQHPGTGERRQVQSVGIHLMTLCLFLEHDADPRLGTELHRRMIRRPTFHRIEAASPASLNVLDVPLHGAPATAREAAFRWARAVWDSYEQEHSTVLSWLAEAGFTLKHESAAAPVPRVE